MILLGGGICGIGGAYCAMIINSGVWISDNVGGLGWIAVALVIFAKWSPWLSILGSFVFGALRVLKYYMPTTVIQLPTAFYDMLPFLMTAIILVVSSIRKNAISIFQVPWVSITSARSGKHLCAKRPHR